VIGGYESTREGLTTQEKELDVDLLMIVAALEQLVWGGDGVLPAD